MARRQFTWTAFQELKLEKVQKILSDYSAYLPLTLRQIFYQMVSRHDEFNNTKSEYNMLSILVKWARIDGHIDWDNIDDESRSMRYAGGWQDKDGYISSQCERFLDPALYSRDLAQDQDAYVELWIEKQALSSVFYRHSRPYGVSIMPTRGYTSVTWVKKYRDRVDVAMDEGKNPKLFYFGDYDPSGLDMPEALLETMGEVGIDLNHLDYKRVALVKSQLKRLPKKMEAKARDSRYGKFITETGGKMAAELDALSPDRLKNLIDNSIRGVFDMSKLQAQVEARAQEKEELAELRDDVRKQLGIETKTDPNIEQEMDNP